MTVKATVPLCFWLPLPLLLLQAEDLTNSLPGLVNCQPPVQQSYQLYQHQVVNPMSARAYALCANLPHLIVTQPDEAPLPWGLQWFQAAAWASQAVPGRPATAGPQDGRLLPWPPSPVAIQAPLLAGGWEAGPVAYQEMLGPPQALPTPLFPFCQLPVHRLSAHLQP